MEGWISLHRKIIDHWIWKDPVKLKYWIDILLSVNYEDTKVNIGMQIYECKKGQSIRSLQTWANRWGVGKDFTRNFLHLLKKDNMILIENLQKTTRITVCNYDSYQHGLHAGQTQAKRKPNASQTLRHTNNNNNNENNDNNENNGQKSTRFIRQKLNHNETNERNNAKQYNNGMFDNIKTH